MILQRALVNLLMVITLAYIVENALHQQPHQINQHQECDQEPPGKHSRCRPNSPLPAENHHGPKNTPNPPTNTQINQHENRRRGGAPVEQFTALLHGGEPVDGLEDGDDAGEVPDRRKVDVDNDKEGEEGEEGEEDERKAWGDNGKG